MPPGRQGLAARTRRRSADSAHHKIQGRVDARQILRIARHYRCVMPTRQQGDARIHDVAYAALATKDPRALCLLAIQCLNLDEAGAQEPRQTCLSTAVSPHLRHDSAGRVNDSAVCHR